MLMNLVTVVQAVTVLKSTEFTTNAAYRLFTKTSESFRSELKTVILYGAALAALYVITVLKDLLFKKISLEVTYNYEKDLNSKLSKIRWDYFEHHDTAVKIHEVRTKSLEAIMNFIDSIMFYSSTFISIFAYGFFLVKINVFIVVVYLALIVLSSKLAGKVFDEVATIWDKIQPHSQKQNYFFGISGNKTGHQEYRFNRLFPFVRDKWDTYFDEEYKLRIKIFKKYEITLQVARIILNIPYILMLIYVSYEIVMGKHDIGFLMLCKAMFNDIVNTFGSVQWYIGRDRMEAKFVKSFFDILELEEEQENLPCEAAAVDICFENVVYRYPQSEAKALNKLSFNIKLGEKIAVVGHNGSGKTTFTNLLMSITDSFEGSIHTGADSPDMVFRQLRNSVACILQDFAQYELTIRENVELGNVNYKFTDEEILSLLQKVGLKDHVFSMPHGIDTKLGQLEEGIELSKGQWQRLAIARLLANEKATVWVLDEPTAYLDPLSEIEIYDLIYKLAGDRTVLFISHRLGFAKKADRIVVFEEGRIAEEGIHSELMKADGRYAEMYKNQEAWYAA
jgi:ATP-binding cassette subfamily B protein